LDYQEKTLAIIFGGIMIAAIDSNAGEPIKMHIAAGGKCE